MTESMDAVLLRLIALVYDAALDPTRWSAVVAAIKEAVGGEASAMLHVDQALGSPRCTSDIVGVSGYEMSDLETYRYYAPIDTRALVMKARPLGSVYVDDRDLRFGAFTETEIFNDFFRPRSLGHGMSVNFFTDDNRLSFLSVHRHLKTGAFDPQTIRLFEALAPHVTRALQLHRQTTLLRIERDGATQALDALAAGLIVVDRNARPLWANGTAERLLRIGDGLGVVQGRLAATARPGQTQALHAMVAEAVATASGVGAEAGAVLRLERRESGSPLAVLVCPLRPDDPLFQRGTPAAVVLVNDPDINPSPRAATLARFYGLTAAQAELLAALVDGQRIADYADEKGISMNTVKAHLKRIFEKTDVNRQSDLVREVLTNPVIRVGGGN